MVIPIGGQYEQCCNAAALQQLGVMTLEKINQSFGKSFEQWMNDDQPVKRIPFKSTQEIVEAVMKQAANNSTEIS